MKDKDLSWEKNWFDKCKQNVYPARVFISVTSNDCAELITAKPRNNHYGEKIENKLWIDFKNELCNQNPGSWLRNASTVKDKPADLGYFVGYEIAKEYYTNAADEKQAIRDIIGMSDPIHFLITRKYDQKVKQ